jgi:hypothetical protein
MVDGEDVKPSSLGKILSSSSVWCEFTYQFFIETAFRNLRLSHFYCLKQAFDMARH